MTVSAKILVNIFYFVFKVDLAQMQETLSECLQMSSLTCIICLDLIGRSDPVC